MQPWLLGWDLFIQYQFAHVMPQGITPGEREIWTLDLVHIAGSGADFSKAFDAPPFEPGN